MPWYGRALGVPSVRGTFFVEALYGASNDKVWTPVSGFPVPRQHAFWMGGNVRGEPVAGGKLQGLRGWPVMMPEDDALARLVAKRRLILLGE
ncbi:MAG: hypothetical protein D6732_13610, partial [Methanobacteriota archaeon]